jgi:hypothetical protein
MFCQVRSYRHTWKSRANHFLRYTDVSKNISLYRVSFFTSPKVFEDGKIPTKKVKVRVKTLHVTIGLLHFHFLVGILPSSKFKHFLGGTSQKRHLVEQKYFLRKDEWDFFALDSLQSLHSLYRTQFVHETVCTDCTVCTEHSLYRTQFVQDTV